MRLPEQFVNRMKEYLGDECDAFLASYDEPEIKGLRINATGDGVSPVAFFDENYGCDSANECSENGSLECIFERIKWEKNGYFCDVDVFDRMSPGKHPYHEAGAYYIQEPSAQTPAFYLDVKPGDRVLDLCASPGGKSTQIGSKMQNKGILITNEIVNSRAKVLSENIERMGIKNALVISEDPRNISDRFECFFDKVLVDAPCSGEGMFRRSEIAIDEWSPENVLMCAERQAWILDEAAKMLKNGGTLVYSTCTFSKEENEHNIASFLERHPDFSPAEMKLFDGMVRGFDDIGVRLYPHKVKGEGHYVCKLVKGSAGGKDSAGSVDSVASVYSHDDSHFKFEQGISIKDKAKLTEMYQFINDNLCGDVCEEILSKNHTLFGDNIYMLPDECPSLKGLKVLRPGLHIGTIKKNRFEPAHALAMALRPSDVKQCINMRMNDNNVIYKYINGETFDVADIGMDASDDLESLDGFTLICVDGFSIGWGKVVNGTVKNHYPKGLRKQL